jgi:hypothetical protein
MTKKAQETSPETPKSKTEYTPEMGDRICAEMIGGEDGRLKSLSSICKMAGMPTKKTVMRWLREQPEFLKIYQIAIIERTDGYAEEALDIADNGSNDWMETNDPENPGYRFNGEHFGRSRLRVDTRKWACAVMNPKKYGPKVALGGAEDLPPVQTADVTEAELARRIAFALASGLKPQETRH